ncbi:MAG: hypothetical protein JKX88_09205, partial [Marinicaulis sp.]|nr:hypothetical protein [Marinicaulis sp.]
MMSKLKTDLAAIPVNTLSPEQGEAELERLAREIAAADAAYYAKDAPDITDAEY